jgi:hypothetical protein
MSDELKKILVQPFKEFYNRCERVYRLGDNTLYDEKVFKIKKKYCFNPYLSTECDVQVKLGGLVEEHFRTNGYPFIVSSEMKLYKGQSRNNQRADLSIHKIPKNNLYLETDSPNQSLSAVIEIKYANAVHPWYEFNNGSIQKDIEKLLTLEDHVLKYMVIIDEANKLESQKVEEVISPYKSDQVFIFSNNERINRLFQ